MSKSKKEKPTVKSKKSQLKTLKRIRKNEEILSRLK